MTESLAATQLFEIPKQHWKCLATTTHIMGWNKYRGNPANMATPVVESVGWAVANDDGHIRT